MPRPYPARLASLIGTDPRARGPALPAVAATPATISTSAATTGARATLHGEAVRAIDGAVIARLERHRCVLAALGADGREHLPFAALVPAAPTRIPATAPTTVAVVAATVAGSTAIRAAAGLVGKAPTREELLFSDGEREAHPTITAGEGLFGVHPLTPSCISWHRSVSASFEEGQTGSGSCAAPAIRQPAELTTTFGIIAHR